MALVQLPGSVWIPHAPNANHAFFALLSTLIDATGEKVAFIGRVWNKDRATKSITKVHFLFGTVTKSGGSGLTVSLQDIDATTNNPFRPDGTQDQTVAIANGDAGFISNAWYSTGALSANRSVAYGEPLAVVIEFDGSGRLGSDAVNIRGVRSSGLLVGGLGTGSIASSFAHYTSSWGAANSSLANVVLEFTDGTFGSFMESWPANAATGVTYHSGSAADEYALRFRFPAITKIDGAWLSMGTASSSSTFDIVLYEGTTVKQTVTVPPSHIYTHGTVGIIYVSIPETQIAANTTHYLALKPTSANNVTLNYIDVSNNSYLQAVPGGSDWYIGARVDAGAWTDTTTRRPLIGLSVSAIDDASGSGGRPELRGSNL